MWGHRDVPAAEDGLEAGRGTGEVQQGQFGATCPQRQDGPQRWGGCVAHCTFLTLNRVRTGP